MSERLMQKSLEDLLREWQEDPMIAIRALALVIRTVGLVSVANDPVPTIPARFPFPYPYPANFVGADNYNGLLFVGYYDAADRLVFTMPMPTQGEV